MALKVMPSEAGGWDVVRDEEGVALSNHSAREEALEAAAMRAEEEHIANPSGPPVELDTQHVHAIDDSRQGMKPAFLALGALLFAVSLLVLIVSLTGSLTGFGS